MKDDLIPFLMLTTGIMLIMIIIIICVGAGYLLGYIAV
jgi:hypothetical protein